MNKQIAQNRAAYHNYFVEEKFEAGVELFGTEVKSIRLGQINLKDSYCQITKGEIFAENVHISPYEKGNIFNRDPLRSKRLLMHKKEIRKLLEAIMRDGYTIVPLSVYLKNSHVKMEIGICKGKKLYDKRESIAKRDSDRRIQREVK